jgi:hypothetical protein
MCVMYTASKVHALKSYVDIVFMKVLVTFLRKCRGNSRPATEVTGPMGREIESRRENLL